MAPPVFGQAAAALAFLLVGIGLHTTQTAGLALASDLAEPDKRHRVVALLYVTLLIGMLLASLSFSVLLADFSQVRLIQVIQGAAVVTMALNIIALWKQEARRPELTRPDAPRPSFASTLRQLRADRRQCRLLVAVALGTAGFSMQDVLLEPYGGEILGLSVGATTLLTALAAVGTLLGFALSARALDGGANPIRLAAYGLLAGVLAFTAVVFASPAGSANLFRLGAFLIGVGGGLFAVGTLTATMDQIRNEDGGRILGAWGAVQATAAGVAIGLSGFIRDVVGALATKGSLGAAMSTPASGYLVVYHIEIALMFLALVAIGPLVGHGHAVPRRATQFGLADHPG
jgi:BCD family chlorophyll transporter-like MFS transporter